MKTNWQSMDSLKMYLTKWGLFTLLISILALAILPFHHEKFEGDLYYWETKLWLLFSLSCGVGLYYSSFPEKAPRWPTFIATFCGITLFGLALFHTHASDNLMLEIQSELAWWRGRCGFLITFMAFVHSLGLFYWARQGAPRSPWISGLWASLSAAGLGCLLMQPVCLHDTSIHLFIWHFFPLTVLTLIGAQTARIALKW